MQIHISFSLRSRAFLGISESVTTHQRGLLSSAAASLMACCSLSNCGHTATSPGRFSAFSKRAISKRAPRTTGIFLKTASRSCVSGCGRFLAASDGHDRCVSCLGYQHAEAALVDESCSHCGNMTIAMLRSRYLLVKQGGIPLAMPRSSSYVSHQRRAHGQGDLRITVRASPSSASPWASHSSCTSHPLVFLDEHAGFSDRAGPSISFGAPADNRMSIAASEGELGSGDDDLAALPPSGRVALPESNQELTAMLSQAAESVWTTLQQLHTSTTKVVYASVACRNSLAIASSGVRSI